jgi:hypothetical protein
MGATIRGLAILQAVALLAGCMSTRTAVQAPVLSQLGRDTDVLMVGEIHGTAEAPAAFGGLVEQAAARKRIAVGLELPDSAIAEAACRSERPAEGSYWLRPRQDGRTSRAMRALVCRLTALRARRRITLFGFAPAARPQPGRHPYADIVQSRARPGGAPMLLLMGNFHNRRAPGSLAQALSDAGLRVVAVTVSSPAGTAFTCDRDGQCGPRPTTARFCQVESPAPVLLVGAAAGLPAELKWDGCLILPSTTSSPPA